MAVCHAMSMSSRMWEVKLLIAEHSKILAYGIFLFSVILCFAVTTVRRLYTPQNTLSKAGRSNFLSGSSLRPPSRLPGVWIPVDFERPAASPYPDWDAQKTKPIPYRPFKYGPYHVTMGLRTLEWDEWIQLDSRFLEWHAIKAKRIQERGAQGCRTAPEAYEGALELLKDLFSYLPQRYPTLYSSPSKDVLNNLLTHETFSLTSPLPVDPMEIAARLIQDDLAIMFERPDGKYYLLAGSILLPGFWRLSDKFGLPLSEIHTSGDVPHYKEKLEKGMENFFRRVSPEKPVVRHNYFIQCDDNLAWSSSIGPEDSVKGWNNAEKQTVIESHHFRTERQTLRRLPRSGGVVFTIRTYFEPIMKVAQEKGVPGRLASAIRSWGEETARYKGREKYGEVLLGYLDECHKGQIKRGEIKEGEEGSYPF